MVKIRLTGKENELQQYVDDFKKSYRVLQVSGFYKNRNSEYYRVYIEMEGAGERQKQKGNIHD